MRITLVTPFLFLCLLNENNVSSKKLQSKRDLRYLSTFTTTAVSAKKIFKDIYKIWEVLLREPDLKLSEALLRSEEKKIISSLIKISSQLSSVEGKVDSISSGIITTLLQAFPRMLELELKLQELSFIVNQINFSEAALRRYLINGYKNSSSEEIEIKMTEDDVLQYEERNNAKYIHKIMKREVDNNWILEHYTLQKFAEWATSYHSDSILALLHKLNELVMPKDGINVGIFNLVESETKEMQSNICNLRQSPHQVLYNLYNTVALTALKGNTVLQFSFMLLKMYDKGNFSVEAKLATDTYKERANKLIEVAQKAMGEADKSIYRCDPKQYVEGITHTKLIKLLEGYIENEVNLNPYGTCRENCQYYEFTEYNGCFKNQFCAHQPQCRGKVIGCRYVDSDMDICKSSNSERRYEWIEYENGKTLGTKGACERRNIFKVDSWWRYLFWHCSYCLCLCDDIGQNSDRYFNLRDVTSDIVENKIVTGVRIVKHNRIIHMQIQQGVLSARGVVDKTSLSWKPVDNYTIDDENMENEVDYHTMNWMERAIDTDEVFAPSEHVVTGLRFRKIGQHLNLEVRVTPINFTTGEVFNEEYSYWLGNDNTDGSLNNPRTEIVLENPDIPIRNGPHILNSKHDQYIQFQPTSFDTDAGQSTVPFLDSQALTSQGFPLSGIGIIHRGKSGSGGFIAPKLITYDFTPHLSLEKIP